MATVLTQTDAACGKCAFFDTEVAAATDALGLCRYNPPVTQPTADAHGLWPKVSDADWCGHYAPGAAH